jgi:quercetin dioxygenase-like cupin family protein
MGISLLHSTTLQRLRVFERLRLTWHDWWDFGNMANAPLRRPVDILKTSEFIQQGENGSVRLLVSPSIAATCNLHVSVVSLAPGREIPSRRAAALEFYYVVSGSGAFSQQGVAETGQIEKGDGFVVDAGSTRWISNIKGTEDLILVRASDGGNRYSGPRFDLIRKDPNMKSTTIDVIAGGIRQVQDMAKEYTKSGNPKKI